MRRVAGTIALHAVLVAGAVATLVPLLWMLSASFMPTGEASAIPPRLLPSTPTVAHYRDLFARLDLARSFANSAGLALAVTAIALVVNSMAGYAFAKLRFAGRDGLFRTLLAALVVPAQVAMLPLFLLLRALGLVDTYAAVVVPGIASVFGIFLFRQYALGIPDSVLDAARIDGAGELRIWRTIVLRLAAPILVTLGLFTFMGTWNDFLGPLVYIQDRQQYTLSLGLQAFQSQHGGTEWNLLMAASVMIILPVIVLFFLAQKTFIEGIATTGMKG